jgi:hypothetical protein
VMDTRTNCSVGEKYIGYRSVSYAKPDGTYLALKG